ncbi:MAG: ornithine cyclodeaminase family protein [Myxococcota bacterium]|nr:ornithine cyclodeaminase family protein [Myxococcota bacterium]MDW8362071.1 ornithine cyclodeaminase family protein [Myxococcales bacterium]
MKLLLLSRQHVESLVDVSRAIAAVEEAFAAHGRAETIMPPKTLLELPHHRGDFRAMPGYFAGSVGVKWVNSHPENPTRHGLPSVMALFILSDPATGAPLALLEATLLTALRTGAAAAVASRHLAAGPPRTLGILGCGAQSVYVVEAHRALWPEVQLRCADIDRDAAERLADRFDGQAVSIEEIGRVDVLCTLTPSRRPLVRRAWLSEPIHINAMGADAPGKQELDPQILIDARIFLDDLEQASASGEVNVPLATGMLPRDRIAGTLGEVIAGRRQGRAEAAITVFDSTGLAIQDTAVARAVYEAARERGIGRVVEL